MDKKTYQEYEPIPTDKLCPWCGQPLIKMRFFKNAAGTVERYIIVCDNTACPAYRSPQGSEKV